jgi:hypothetical protein
MLRDIKGAKAEVVGLGWEVKAELAFASCHVSRYLSAV